jgi:hypothetical protein
MGQGRARVGRRRLAGLVGALLLGLGLAISPASAPIVAAADPLQVSADATYILDPPAGRVHVLIQYRVKDLKPNSAQFVYFYTGYRFAIQREARSIKASDSGGGLSTETRNRASYIDLTVDFRRNIFYGETAKFSVRYDLVGGAPRSASFIRIGKAFATWGVWAWGDAGRGSVVVNLPQGFGSTIDGDPMSKTSSGGRETLQAAPEKPESFFAILSAENPLAYTKDRVSLDGGVEIVVMAWPEDTRWDDTVGATLRTAMPELRELIGLPWPVAHDLDVRERYTPALEGYAGLFFNDQQRIDVSEDLDPVVIVHEASHAWFNGDLFVERWIYEGLAQEYAWRVQQAVGGDDGGLPESPNRRDAGFVRLESWAFPEVIRDPQTDDTERYGYQASFWVVHRIVDTVGVDRMRAAFAAAEAHTTAYPGAATPERVTATNSWKRFLDLVESLEGNDSTDTERSLRDLVLPSGSTGVLDDRTVVRKAYRELLEAGDGWLPSWYVRKPMGEWSFGLAEHRITEATAVLDLRAQVETVAAPLGLHPDGALETAYEGADSSLDAATALANEELATLAAIADAKAKVEAQPDLVSKVGLIGSIAQVPYDAARAAFERGDIAGAKSSAAQAAAIVTGAAALGQQRLALGIGVAVGLLLLAVALIVLRRRRRRRRHSPTMADAATTTLAADPNAAPPSTSEPPSEMDGGATHGDPPADSASPSTG